MHCQRCLNEEAWYRAYTDYMDIPVCSLCAEEARKFGILVEILDNSHTSAVPLEVGSNTPISIKR